MGRFYPFKYWMIAAPDFKTTHRLKLMLSLDLPPFEAMKVSQIKEIRAGGGYERGGWLLKTECIVHSDEVLIKSKDFTFRAKGKLGPFRYLILYDADLRAPMGFWEEEECPTLRSGGTYTLKWKQNCLLMWRIQRRHPCAS